MIWVDREAKKIIERKLPVEWVDDMKTPSGRIHVGSLRGMLVHDLMYKVLKEKNLNVHFSYVFNDMDQMDSIPSYLDQKKWSAYSGKPLNKIPSPEPGYESFADYYAQEFIQVFNSINCHPEIIWSHELYESGKMNDVIKLFLDNADKVREIYKRIAKADRAKDWYPFNPICEKCGNIGTTNVTKWDGEFVYYTCEPKIVDWATGCGHVGKISPYNGNGKLPWKLDWPAHWKTIGVTIEGAGKDHMSSGGSYDMAATFCKEILHYEAPYPLAYEWFTIGGKKMSSSKGIGTSAKEVSSILPPEVFRFLIVRTPIGTHLDFHPYGVTIPNLFDDYDQCMNAYFMKIENSLPQGKQGEVLEDYARIVELSAVRFMPKNKLYLPRFRTIANMLNQKPDFISFFEGLKKSSLNAEEKLILEERIKFAKIYIENYAENNVDKNSNVNNVFSLNETQRKFLQLLIEKLKTLKTSSPEEIQTMVFSILKENNFKPKEVFQGFYQTLLGKDFGPKAHDVIIQIGIPKIIEKLTLSINTTNSSNQASIKNIFPDFKNDSIFSIDPAVKKLYPSISIGIAIIKNVTIQKSNTELQSRINNFVNSQSNLTNEMISSFKEVLSYRKLYKQMSIDWHSRRPSPEALLRRIATKKGLYSVNTCVDAYNLVVMNNRVSSGAFDLDKIKFPTILRLPKPDEKILLLGDKEPTLYKPTELAYFDQNGGYNIDFNFRDSQETAVTEQTKNILINIDGIYDINRSMVEKTLKETLDEIIKYCGGKIEISGIVQ